jgi:hypothetical protein
MKQNFHLEWDEMGCGMDGWMDGWMDGKKRRFTISTVTSCIN